MYKTFEGWVIESAKTYDELPQKAQRYLEYIESYLNVPIKTISIGPERNDTIFK